MPDFESLVDDIYEAAADPDCWPRIMHDIGKVAEAAGGVLIARRADAWLGWRCSVALEKGAEAFFSSGGLQRSQVLGRLLAFNRAGFVSDQEGFTEEEYAEEPVIKEWCAPNGIHHCTATAVPMLNGDLVMFQIKRRKGEAPFGPAELDRLDALRPHLARAGLLAARWRLERLRSATEALATLGIPAAILDVDGRVLAANRLIEDLSSHHVWMPRDRIALIEPAADKLLRGAIADLGNPAATSVRSFPSKGTGERRVVMHLIPVTGIARDLFGGGLGVLMITHLTRPATLDAALVQSLFDLTPTEARVAGSLAEGLTLDQIAKRHKVKLSTVRSQVKSVFAKTGSNRQSQIVALLAAQPKIWRPPLELEQSQL
ncbi:helix-turn-helix transcriptional regulator [Methylocystis sp. L43]|uniref:helix-turn-helix transcriptional regulator n=1 Tax=unclassified Methylocystis TaxID=2625913 RepID=UPI0018C2B127|nr:MULTISPECIES: helix-turn-helix transcriptional regulator [unclassified Methylocystis]MBG0796616.1 helix-turn-helix transcriptional regulator [Methylocystis sp. L43]MBG0804563.1 helix-turn-helix transcriptional regulator [Methylocystis sp. H15]